MPWWTHLFRRGRERVIKDVTEAYSKGRYLTANTILPTALDDELESLLLETEMTMGWNV